MNTAASLVRELGTLLRGWGRVARAKRAHLEALRVGAAEDLHAELVDAHRANAAAAYTAETADREALRLLEAATSPDSDGGEHVTPAELVSVRRLITQSAELDHDLAEASTL